MSEPLVRFLPTSRDVISAETTLSGTSAAEVYELVSQPRRHHELDGAGTVRHQVRGPERPGEGEATTQFMRLYGIPYTITAHVVRAERDRAFAWRMPTGHTWAWEMEPAGDDVVVRETFDASGARALGLPLARAFRLGGAFRRNREGIARSLAALHRTFARP
ncbi:polyketide cyclase [Rothia sp. AR01]|uniref:Polyketide cyclase n=1 Tax=Rothia santali TaxID=2949643 RepID=A0A9X2HC14_9MICC|nr:SRPBCC family protein [Rothia santali]MCP3426591.1 polyketide cyclase [Rothia santali]